MRWTVFLTIAMVIAISGCVGTDSQVTPGPTSSGSPATEPPPSTQVTPEITPSPGDTATDAPEEPSVFEGSVETPPGGVSDFLSAIPGGGIDNPCVLLSEEAPEIAILEDDIPTSLCGVAFLPEQAVSLLLRGPGGKEWTEEMTVNEGGFFEWGFPELPRRLQGEYFARAVQGDTTVERTFNVQLDSLKAAVVPRYFPRGGSTELVIAGGEAGDRVPVHLYRERAPDQGYDYVANVGPLTLNDNGQVRVDLKSRKGDERGKYMVVVDPRGVNIGYWFVLGPKPEQ